MYLVLTEGAGHPMVHLDEERRFADQCCRVIGVGAQREVAVTFGWRDGGEYQRAARRSSHQRRHLAEAVRDEIAGGLVESLAVSLREEPGDVAEAREVAVHVPPLPIREHLVDTDPREPSAWASRASSTVAGSELPMPVI